MIVNLIFWYLVLALAGWLAFPLAYRLLAFLPDRGLAFARPLGLLLWGYACWLLVSLHVLQNDTGGVFFGLLLLAGLSAWQLRKGGWRDLLAFLRERRKLVIATELLFLALFAFMALVRSTYPEASGTEKPMELAFINAILRSPAFPPSDPWLSGYAISYYYFGYAMVAMLARITGTPGAVAFNLALASWYALTGLAAYGIVYNLLAGRAKEISRRAWLVIAPLFAPLFLLLVSNLEGFLEMLHARGIFWQHGADGQLQSTFWQWLNIQEITAPPAQPFQWTPQRPGGIWWWRTSRVLQDFDWTRQTREIIDEVPAFTYLLDDLHPHVLSMPFVLLAVALALNVYLRLRAAEKPRLQIESWLVSGEFWLSALALGGLSFLNTWDFPIYLALFAAAATLPQLVREGWRWQPVIHFLEILFTLGIAGIVLYLPFYLGFASQASGLLPSLIFFTRGVYFWVMFGTLLIPIVLWLITRLRRGIGGDLVRGLLFSVGLLLGLWLLSSLLGVVKLRADPSLSGIYGAPSGAALVLEAITRRLAQPGAWITLLALLALTLGLVQAAINHRQQPEETTSGPTIDLFVLLLVLLGAGLTLFPEFFYLRDQFGWRMNTIFKFYFQAWIIWSLASGFASAVLWEELRKTWQVLAFGLAWLVLVGIGLVYPFFGFIDRSNHFSLKNASLSGADYLQRYSPDEWAAIQWLQTAPYGIVTEAVGGSYTDYARVSTQSGLPTVLGWPGHESQWRGGAREIGSRESDIAQLYQARTWDQAWSVLSEYHVRYVYLGSLERSKYHANSTLFDKYLRPVFSNAAVTIYEVPGYNSP